MAKFLSKINDSLGFTIIEMVVSIFGFIIVSMGLTALVSGMLNGTSKQSALLADADQARKLAFSVTDELRRLTTSSTGAYGLEQAGAQQIIFYADIDGDGAPERIRYFLQNGSLKKGVITPTGSPLGYTGSEQVMTVQSNVGNGSSPLFYYYDGTYKGTTDNYMVQPVNVTSVKYVKLSVKILNKGGISGTQTYEVSSSAAVRNLKTNLGN